LTHSAPLFLLFETSVQQLEKQYMGLVRNHDEISMANASVGASSSIAVLFDGLVLRTNIMTADLSLQDKKNISKNLNLLKIDAMIMVDLGDNLKGGETIPPIIEGLLAFARRVGEALGAVGLYWRPAKILSDFSHFAQSVQSYEDDGIFPVSSLIDMTQSGSNIIESNGLSFLSTQEVCVSYNDITDTEAMQNASNIASNIASNGPLLAETRLRALDNLRIIEIKISPSGEQLFATITSKSDQ
jgi:hypothetical protein